MYNLFLIFVLLSFSDTSFGQESASLLCRGNMAKYCRPRSPRKYGPPHNNYRSTIRGIATEAPVNPTTESITPTPVKTFEDLAQDLIAAELAIRNYCLNNAADVKEIYRERYYVLSYTLGDGDHNATVRIKHNLIYVTVKKSGVTIIEDLRILSNVLNVELAAWEFGNNNLEIVIPYASYTALNSKAEKCQTVNTTLVNVPQNTFMYKSVSRKINDIFGNPEEQIDIRFNNLLLRK